MSLETFVLMHDVVSVCVVIVLCSEESLRKLTGAGSRPPNLNYESYDGV